MSRRRTRFVAGATMLVLALSATTVGASLPDRPRTEAASPATTGVPAWAAAGGAAMGAAGSAVEVVSSGRGGSGIAAAADAGSDPYQLVVRVRGTEATLGKVVRVVIEDAAAGMRRHSAPVHLSPHWQAAGVTIPAGSGRLALSVVETGPRWVAGDAYAVELVRAAAAGATVTSTSGRQMLVAGSPHKMYGYNYAAGPIGTPVGATATNLASWHTSPAQCQSDAALMAAAGVNTLRIQYLDVYDDRAVQCMDAFHANGVGLLWLVNGPGGVQRGEGNLLEPFWVTLENTIRQVKDHPATFGYVIGNEVNNEGNNEGLQAVCQTCAGQNDPDGNFRSWLGNLDTLAARTKALDPDHVTTTSLTSGHFDRYVRPGAAPNLDMWAMNRYPLSASGYPSTLWAQIASQTTKPVWISEFGVERLHCTDHAPGFGLQVAANLIGCPTDTVFEDTEAQADWNEGAWQGIAANLSADNPAKPMVGGTVFMWADWWSFEFAGWNGFGSPLTHDTARKNNAGNAAKMPDGAMNVEWWGSTLAMYPHQPGPRVTLPVYDRMASLFTGTPGPSITTPSASAIGPCAVTLSWTTDVPTSYRIDFGLTRDVVVGNTLVQDDFVADLGKVTSATDTSWTVRLTGLRHGQSYRAYARGYDAGGRIASADPVTFTTTSTGPGGECSVP